MSIDLSTKLFFVVFSEDGAKLNKSTVLYSPIIRTEMVIPGKFVHHVSFGIQVADRGVFRIEFRNPDDTVLTEATLNEHFPEVFESIPEEQIRHGTFTLSSEEGITISQEGLHTIVVYFNETELGRGYVNIDAVETGDVYE